MTDRIDTLTEAQETLIPVYRDKRLAIGLNTDRVDFDEAVAAVKKAVECARTLPNNEVIMPTKFFLAKSPDDAFKMAKKMFPDITIDTFMSNTLWGSQDADFLSFYDYMQEVVGVKNLEIIDGLREMAVHCGWTTIMDDVCIIQEKPSAIHFDNEKRTHAENGPAIEYEDGYSVMIWHGQRIPREWITKGLTVEEALSQTNLDMMSAACEIVGWHNIVDESDTVTILDEDDDPTIGKLLEIDLGGEFGKQRLLYVLCATGRYFALPAFTHNQETGEPITTALQANAYSWRIDPQLFKMIEVQA